MTPDLFSLENKVALITGGYGHLGTSIATGLAEQGATVYILAKDENKFKTAFIKTPESIKSKLKFTYCDISNSSSIQKAFNLVFIKEGNIDILINNAFYSKGSNPETITDLEWNFAIDGTLNSVYRCIREIIPHFKNSNSGRIINVASMYGIVSPEFSIYEETGAPYNPPHYGAAKAGVIQLTKYYAVYLARYNVNVNVISPGAFPRTNSNNSDEFKIKLSKKTPMNRTGKPDDLKGGFIFLASDASSYITGQNLIIDGGWSIW